MELIIAGDFYFDQKDTRTAIFSDELIDLFAKSTYNIVDLEAPLTTLDNSHAISKTGPNIKMDGSNAIRLLKQLNVNAVALANNHIMDYGPQALQETINTCKANTIAYVGAGMNSEEVKSPIKINNANGNIAILNFAENEWSSSAVNKPGANPLDIIENTRQIQETKKKHDVVIVIIHGGHEYYSMPSPRMVNQYRFYAEAGASVIVGHHPHCISGYEVHQGVPIFYSLGNFLFTIPSKYKVWYTGLLLKLTINNDLKLTWELIPIQQQEHTFAVSVSSGKEKQTILENIQEYNKIIADDNKLEQQWQQFIQQRREAYLGVFSPANIFGNRYINAGFRYTGLDKLFIHKKQYKQILNTMRCEAHANAAVASIENFLNK